MKITEGREKNKKKGYHYQTKGLSATRATWGWKGRQDDSNIALKATFRLLNDFLYTA